MMNRSTLLLIGLLSVAGGAFAQTDRVISPNPNATPTQSDAATQVEAQGIGLNRESALQDALRAAIGKAVGVAVKSTTTVENFVVVQDAIATNSTGYIKSYEVVSEGNSTAGYQVTIRALVTLKALEADAVMLSKALGGVRWMVAYDPRTVSKEEKPLYDQAVERMNEFLAGKRYRYIEKSRFEALQNEAMNLGEEQNRGDSAGQLSYAQRLGMAAGAQFMLFISKINTSSRSEAFDTRTASRVSIEAKAFDNCTAEGLGTVVMDSDWAQAREGSQAQRTGLQGAVQGGMPRLLEMVNSYIGDWVNNGTPYELRFYGIGGFREFRDLRKKLTEDALYGGQLEVTSVDNYTRLNGTFRRQPSDMADRVLDAADEVPDLAAKRLDVKMMFGRQLNFAPTGTKVPGLPASAETSNAPAKKASPAIGPAKKAASVKASKATVKSKPKNPNQVPLFSKTTSSPKPVDKIPFDRKMEIVSSTPFCP